MATRPTPYDLVFADGFADGADEPFSRIRAALAERGGDPSDRDAFLMEREVITLIRDLRPEDGIGEGIEQLAALVHHAYLFWAAERPVRRIGPERLAALLAAEPAVGGGEPPAALYAQLPEHRLWAAVVPGGPAEPLDGCFVHANRADSGAGGSAAGEALRVLGVFGLRPDRPGFSVVEAAGERPGALVRPDGSPIFSPTLPGAAGTGLHSLTGAEELLELGWRAWTA